MISYSKEQKSISTIQICVVLFWAAGGKRYLFAYLSFRVIFTVSDKMFHGSLILLFPNFSEFFVCVFPLWFNIQTLPNIFGNNCPWHKLLFHILSKTNRKAYSIPWPLLRRSWAAAGTDNIKPIFPNCFKPWHRLSGRDQIQFILLISIRTIWNIKWYHQNKNYIKIFLVNTCDCLYNNRRLDNK